MDGESVIFTCEYPAPETSRTASRDAYMERLDITQNAKQHPIEAPMFPDTDTLPIEIVNSNRALQLFRDIQTDTQSLQEQKTFIESGLIYHALFEHLTSLTADDVQKSVNTYRLNHELDALHEKTFRRFVEAAQSHHILREAFSPDAQTLTEAAFIVTTDNGVETLRPDKVALLSDRAIVIDYKFSSYKHLLLNDSKHIQQRQDYYRQLQQYVTMIERFYHVPAEGWFWFLRDNKVINVNNLNN
jgi:ATP-dependent exoDNAse (exonuclease V) beta subunit